MNTSTMTFGTPETFKNVRAAGAYLAKEANIDPYNASDCLYKAMRTTNKSHSTHGFRVERAPDNKGVILTKILSK